MGGGGPGRKWGGLRKIWEAGRGVYEKFLGYEGGSMKKIMTRAAGGSMKNKWLISVSVNFSCAYGAFSYNCSNKKFPRLRRKFLIGFSSNDYTH